MLETISQTPEIAQPTDQGYQMVSMLTSDEVLSQRHEWLVGQLQDPVIAHYGQLHDEKIEATKKMYEADKGHDREESQEQEAKINQLSVEQNKFSEEDRAKYENIRRQLSFLDRHTYTVESDSIEARVIQELLSQAPCIQPTDGGTAPFANWGQNNPESWQYVPDSEVRSFLSKRRFIDTTTVQGAAQPNDMRIETGRGDQPLDVPLDLIAGLPSFDSWLGRGVAGSTEKKVSGPYAKYYNRKAPSHELIKHYASLPSELPPVDTVRLFIQPDGTVFGDNAGSDTHRIAAAVLRGDTTIKANNLTIKCLEENIIKPVIERTGLAAA